MEKREPDNLTNTGARSAASQMKTHATVTTGRSPLSRYQDVIVGRRSLAATVTYEWCVWLGCIPGALGLLLRKVFWPRILGSCGKGVLFGTNIILRHPERIHIGHRVIISESCILDARNQHTNDAIVIEDDVILSNSTMISCKNGSVKIGARSGIGAQTIIHSVNANPVSIGADVIIGPRCYIVGGGNYNLDRLDIPIWRQGIKNEGGVTLEDDVWLGSNVSVLGGVTVHTGSVAAAGAIITKSVPARVVCSGQPAKILKTRQDGAEKDPPSFH